MQQENQSVLMDSPTLKQALDVLVLSIWVVAISSFGFLVGDQ